jgi:hypothetical protein
MPRLKCVNGHDRCYEGTSEDCPYCEHTSDPREEEESMIRFVDIREAETGYNFAFWDTVTDKFVSYGDEMAWDTFADFKVVFAGDETSLDRFRRICPAWAKPGI